MPARIALNLLVHPNTKARLVEQAARLDAIATRGPYKGQPSISTLIKEIGAGEIILTRRRSRKSHGDR